MQMDLPEDLRKIPSVHAPSLFDLAHRVKNRYIIASRI
jgi:hypothetical protein